MFQAIFKGWKGLAASLVLLPGLAAIGADCLHLLGTAQAEERPASQPDTVQLEKAKKMLLEARAAYEKGDYGKAQELTEKIKAMNIGMPWWTDDSPDALLSDIKRKNGGKLPNKVATTKEDPRVLLHKGRMELEAGRLDAAQDIAHQAEANGRNTDWGLFEDTPASLLKDIQKAQGKRDRARADKLLRDARYLYERRAATDDARAANLDRARSMALEAAHLHGPYGMFDFGDRPQSLIREIDHARSKLKVAARKAEPKKDVDISIADDAKDKKSPFDSEAKPASFLKSDAASAKSSDGSLKSGVVVSKHPIPGVKIDDTPLPPEPPEPIQSVQSVQSVQPTQPNQPAQSLEPAPPLQQSTPYNQVKNANAGPSASVRKSQAVDLMKQAHTAEIDGRYVEARELLNRARSQNALFGPDEETPDTAMQSLNEIALKHINKLCFDAHRTMIKKTAADLAEAERKLNEGDTLANAFGLDRYALNELRGTLRAIKGKTEFNASTEAPPPLDRPSFDLPPGASLPSKSPPATPANPVALPPAGVSVNPAAPPIVALQGAASANGSGNPSQAKVVTLPDTFSNPPQTPTMTPPSSTFADQPSSSGGDDVGMQMLRQAHLEIQHSQLENARHIAMQVINGPYSHKSEAEALLRTIDTEEMTQKRLFARRSYDHAVDFYTQKSFEQALSIFKQIDPLLLPPQQRSSMASLMVSAQRSIDRPSGLVAASGPGTPTQLPPLGEGNQENSLMKQEEALRELKFQKLRAKGLEVEASATARFGKGETDAALFDLRNFIAEVKAANLDQAKVNLLVRPVENRIEKMQLLKHHQDYVTKEAQNLKMFRTAQTQDQLQKEYKREQIAQLMKDFKKLCDEGKYQEAGKVALRARELDPDDPGATAAIQMARMFDHRRQWEDQRAESDEWRFRAGNDAFKIGAYVDTEDPVKYNLETWNRIRNRQSMANGIGVPRPQTERERDIERQLNSKKVTFNFINVPLDEVVAYFHTATQMNFDIDTNRLRAEGIDLKQPITSQMTDQVLGSALTVVLEKANLRHIIYKDCVRITTQRGAKGALVRRTIPVTDLVVPIPNFAAAPIEDLNSVLTNHMQNARANPPGNAGPVPFTPYRGLKQDMGNPVGMPSVGTRQLVNSPAGMAGSGGQMRTEIKSPDGTIEEMLIRLITNSIQPDSWEAMGGAGHIEYYPLGMALVINQTPDVIEEVQRLLEALRQLQDMEVSIEIRMITLAESFYERIGVDFSMNLNTHNSNALVNLTQQNGLFSNFTNLQQSGVGKVIGLAAPGVPTPDLNVPISASSFGPAIPPFGNFPNAPGLDGGISVGLAFLSDIQVQLFMELAQGDTRTNVMQAPKLTMFNGQSAQILVNDQQFFMLGVQVTSVNGQLVFVPQNTPVPLGVRMNVQPVVSGDRRFVRLNVFQSMTNLASATVPLFPITTIITPVFDGGAQGQPVPFTQYMQQPTFTTVSVQTTVVVPDGGTVLLGGMKTLSEGRNEFGPPILSKIPYIDRLFRNVGYGREVQTLMMMVTPRIIINREEQERQTGYVEPTIEIP